MNTVSSVAITDEQQAAIRKRYRALRAAAEKTQIQVETQAGLAAGRFWKIENGFVFPTAPERHAIAGVLTVDAAELPAAVSGEPQPEAQAS